MNATILAKGQQVACTLCGHICRIMVYHRGEEHICHNCIEAYDRRAETAAATPEAAQRARGAALPPVGTQLSGRHSGADYRALITAEGIEYGGRTYPSLTAAAQAITGKSISGPRFWGLRGGAE